MVRSQMLQAVSIRLNAPSGFEHGLIVVPEWALPFFREGYKGRFTLRAPGKTAEVYLNSARNAKVGDPVGRYLWGDGAHRENVFRSIFAADRGWKVGAWANFERLPDGSVRVTLSPMPRFYHQGDDGTPVVPPAPQQTIVRRRGGTSSTKAAA